jgi:hypothetical protein
MLSGRSQAYSFEHKGNIRSCRCTEALSLSSLNLGPAHGQFGPVETV